MPNSLEITGSKKLFIKGLEDTKILTALNGESMYIDDLTKLLKIPVSKLNSDLTKLEILGVVKKEGVKYFRIS
ncbi:ArsR family transcriptional regulator [bacterium]|nr:ArsR family transcriptional regulator [bacterium]